MIRGNVTGGRCSGEGKVSEQRSREGFVLAKPPIPPATQAKNVRRMGIPAFILHLKLAMFSVKTSMLSLAEIAVIQRQLQFKVQSYLIWTVF